MKSNMEFKYLTEIVEFYNEFVRPYGEKPRGCQESEIDDLEKHFGFELPLAYKEYLRFMGRDYTGIFVGSEFFVSDAIDNTNYLPELLAENKVDFALPQNYLVFFSHQGWIAAWFELPKKDENPPVWYFAESYEKEPPKITGTFTEFIFNPMKDIASMYRKNNE
jgi:hypothetical protein